MRFLFKKKDTGNHVMAVAENKFHSRVHWISETGPVRSHNEDSVTVSFLRQDKQNLVAVLADGMGGHNAGEVASSMACEYISGYVLQHYDKEESAGLLKNAMQYAHSQIAEAGKANAAQKGMGTTAIVVFIKAGILYFGHIGDSRLYQYNSGSITQLTRDQTLVNDMYEKGEISKAERDAHPVRNVLLQALGTVAVITPQVSVDGIILSVDDKFLLCSDGVYDVCSDTELESLMRMDDPSFILECIRCIAMCRNASDNFSAIMLSFSNAPLPVAAITREQNIML